MTRIVMGISGASGVVYAIRMLQVFRQMDDVETHLVMSPAAKQTIVLETDWKPADVARLATVHYRHGDITAAISSGSFRTDGMIVLPCSARSLGAIAMSLGGDLLTRAADVTLKEGRPLVLAFRETPLHLGHIRSMEAVVSMGATMVPLMPSFYTRPKNIEDLVDQTVARLLDQLGMSPPEELIDRWEGPKDETQARLEKPMDGATTDRLNS